MALSVLDQAKKAYSKKKYFEVISLLQPHVIDYRDSFTFHLFLGLAFLHVGEIGSAIDYFSRSEEIKWNDPNLLSAQAVLFLRRGDTNKAADCYLQALTHNPNFKLAKQGLEFLKANNTPEKIGDYIQSGKIKILYPNPTIAEKRGKLAVVSMVFAICLVAIGIILPYVIKNRNFNKQKRQDISQLNLVKSDRQTAVELEGNYRYILTNDEVIKAYEQAQRYFQNYQDNKAQVEINKILSSNASVAIKQKAHLLMDLFIEPSFDTVKDIYSYQEVLQEPVLYLDCWVIWRGMATNSITGTYNTAFDLMVGYDTKQKLEGIVPVFCNFVTEIDTERPIEVLGKIELKNGVLCLKATSIHQSGKPINKK